MTKSRLLAGFALVGLVSVVGCAAPADEVAVSSADALSSPSFAADVAKVEERLAALRSAEAAEKKAALELAIAVQERDRAFENYVLGRAFLKGQFAHKDAKGATDTIARMRVTKKNMGVMRTKIRDLQLAHKKRRTDLEMVMKGLRGKAASEAELTGQSGVFPLQVLASDYAFGMSRRLPSLHTQVRKLRDQEQCRGDFVLQGMIGAYLRAAVTEDERAVMTSLSRMQQQLSCMSTVQLRALEAAMVAEIDTTLARTLAGKGALAATRFRQMIAIPLLLLADQNRVLRGHGKPGLAWLVKNKAELTKAAATPGSVLHRLGFVVYDRRAHRLVPVSSKAQRANKRTAVSFDTKNVVFKDAKGVLSTNGLPSFVEALTDACFGADLVPESSDGKTADRYACDPGCGKATTERAKMGAPGVTPRAPSTTAASKCPTTGGSTGTGTGSTGGSGVSGGDPGITLGGGVSTTQCMMNAVKGSLPSTTLLSCMGQLHPAAGAPGMAGDAPKGAKSCRPGVADDEGGEGGGDGENGGYGHSQGTYTPEGSNITWNVYEDADGNTTFVNAANPAEVVVVTAEEMADNENAAEDALRNSPSGAAEQTANDPPPAPEGSTSASGNAGSPNTSPPKEAKQGIVAVIWQSIIQTQAQESLEDLELMTYQDENGDGMCMVNPQCMAPNAPKDCASDEGSSCSGGCTGMDEDVTAFNDCITGSSKSKTTAPTSGLGVPDTLVDPSPDSDAFTSPVGGLLACLGGGAPVDTTCAGQSVKLCTADKPDCNCANKAVTPVAPPAGVRCEQVQCAASTSSTAMGERDEGTPMGAGMCGCQSVMGGG